MKKLLILFLALTFVGGLAFGGPINIALDASSTLKWRITGNLMNNQATFGIVPQFIKTPSVSQTADFDLAPIELVLGLTVADADKVTIVKAESTIDMTGNDIDFEDEGDLYDDVFHYIEFPNVIPGMLGVLLHKAGTLSTDVTSKASTTSVPNVVATIVPIKDAVVKVGLAYKTGVLYEKFNDVTAGGTSTSTSTAWYLTASPPANTATVTYTATATTAGLYTLYLVQTSTTAASTTSTKSTEVGTYMDFAASLYASYKLMLGEKDNVTLALGTVFDTAWSSGVVTETTAAGADNYTKDAYQAYVVADNPVAADGEKWGWATLPIGLKVGLAMGDLTANVTAKLRLTQGKDALNLDTNGDPRAWGVPMYAKVDAAYKLVVGDMTITPAVNFQYSSDYWKYWYDAADDEAWEYKGEVSGAEFIARPMSFGLSVPVVGIAKMVDVTLSGSAGFGDGEFAYGAYGTTAGMATTTWADYVNLVNDAADNVVADAMAYKFGLTVTAKPIKEVMVKNELTYNHDGLGFVGQSSGARWGSYLNRIKDVLTGEYYLKVADATAATFYCILTFQSDTFDNSAKVTNIVDYAVPEVAPVENAGKTILDYELGVKVTVKY